VWWASVPRERWPQDADTRQFIAENWVDGVGDARQELVFIGIDMDEDGLRHKLGAALLSDKEMALGPHGWTLFDDPVPEWTEH
ncbi:GTP-binding protein, partial [Winslowiella iniecta]